MTQYEVMARRYRPSTFEDVVGQEPVANTLRQAIVAGRVAHAYLFCGGHGCGKTSMARILAKALVCQRPDGGDAPTPQPCGECGPCLDITSGRDADVVEIDAASNRGIDDIRKIRDQAAYVPVRDRFKIYIIDEVHMLSTEAFNALLKTLEEPPAHVKFILATTDPHRLPETVLSRCQRFDFRLVGAASLSRFLGEVAQRENAAVEPDALDAVAAFAGGSVRDGLVLLDQLISYADGPVTRRDVERLRGAAGAEAVAGLFGDIAGRRVAGALVRIDELMRQGVAAGDFLDQLMDFGRVVLRRAAACRDAAAPAAWDALMGEDGLYGPAREAAAAMAQATPVDTALLWLDVLSQARIRTRQRVLGNPWVAVEMAIARLAGLDDPRPVGDLVARLEALTGGKPPPPRSNPTPPVSPAREARESSVQETTPAAPPPVPAPVATPVAAPVATPSVSSALPGAPEPSTAGASSESSSEPPSEPSPEASSEASTEPSLEALPEPPFIASSANPAQTPGSEAASANARPKRRTAKPGARAVKKNEAATTADAAFTQAFGENGESAAGGIAAISGRDAPPSDEASPTGAALPAFLADEGATPPEADSPSGEAAAGEAGHGEETDDQPRQGSADEALRDPGVLDVMRLFRARVVEVR